MVGFSSLNNINQENINIINFFCLDNNLIFIVVVIFIIFLKIIRFWKSKEEKRREAIIFSKTRNTLTYYENGLFKGNNLSNIDKIMGGKNKFNNNKNKKRMNVVNNNNAIITNNKIIIVSILINIFYQIKNNIFDLFYFQDSKITLKIKGIGYNNILGYADNYNFQGINKLKDVYINGIKQNETKYIYYFNQSDNFVELIWHDGLSNCQFMFRKCVNITEINFSDFDTSHLTYLWSMFSGCKSLTSIDFSNFNTSQVTCMFHMFTSCSSLTSLDLSNFNTSQVADMTNMFKGCVNLEYINMNNFEDTKLNQSDNMFDNVPENIVICLNKNINYKIMTKINNKNCSTIDCSNNLKSKQKKLINNNTECIDSCDNNMQYPYEYNGKCYENCINGFLKDENGNQINKCKCELEQCLDCPNVALNKNLCTKCNINYYPKENDPLNIGKYIVNCYKDLEGYYLDNDIYKQCYHTCKTCNIAGNNTFHNCLECNDIYPFGIQNGNYLNCSENCSYYYYSDKQNNYFCTNNLSCPKEYPKLNVEKNECIKNDIKDIIKDFIKNETEIKPGKEQIEYYDNLIYTIEQFIASENYDTSKLDNGKDEVIETDKMTVTLTTSKNEKSNINNNMTAINLGTCENLLKDIYNISNNETLYMKKIEVFQDGMKIPKIEFDVYSKLSGTNLVKLNLTVCENSKISISIPIILTESLDILNSSSGYYNDICYTTTSEDGTDITLNDRKTDFINKNKTVCQEDCVLSNYNKENMKVECLCKVKESSKSISDININKDKLFENFKNIKNFLNFNFLVCYKNLLKKEGIIYNIGSYLILAIILFHIITIIFFYIYDFSILKKKIKQLIFGINKNHKNKKRKKFDFSNKLNKNKILIYSKDYKRKIKKSNINNIKAIDDLSKRRIIINNSIKNPIANMQLNKISDYIDEEINELSFNSAIQYDKRSYCQFYISLIKTKHSLILALFNNKDYNSKIIKIDLFFIGFSIDYIINALFFNDDTMHKIYQNKGKFDFETLIPIMVYSMIISWILNLPLNFLSMSNDAILSFKQFKYEINIVKRAKYLEDKLNIKFILYFVISFLFLSFFWYYISIFCVIYKNTQIHLIKDTLMSFGLSLFIPFALYLIPGFFRIPALSDSKNKRKYLYNFSLFLQSLL